MIDDHSEVASISGAMDIHYVSTMFKKSLVVLEAVRRT